MLRTSSRASGLVPAVASTLLLITGLVSAEASDTPDPVSVTVVGSLQEELGCPGDWQPDCADTGLTFDSGDGVWQAVFDVPAGEWEYKAALSGSWDENYGGGAVRNGANIPLSLGDQAAVKFYYDHETHWVTDNVNSTIAVAPGNFQSELGCPGDWDPSCLRSWLQDPDGDGILEFRTSALPAGDYEAKVAIDESWDENYGEGGVANGPNIAFSVPTDCTEMLFSYDRVSHLLSVGPAPAPAQPASVTIAGSLQSELGCPGDWQPDCGATHLGFDAADAVWQASFDVPAGSWEYKAALDDSWDENYGANATRNGANIALNADSDRSVKFYYDHATHWVTDNVGSTIAVAPGNFQSELGCPGDWDPSCLRSWLQDPDGDGVLSFTARLPAGNYEAKVAINESWDENYGQGGAPGGANIPFSVPETCAEVFFAYDPVSHVLSVSAVGAPKGNIQVRRAHWISQDAIAWQVAATGGAETVLLHFDPEGDLVLEPEGVVGGESIPLTYDPEGMSEELAERFPHLAGLPVFRIASGDVGSVPQILKGRVAVSAAAAGGSLIDATGLQIPGVLDDLYFYEGPLGPVVGDAGVSVAVWAPTARNVSLQLFDDAGSVSAATVVPMTPDPATGVWSVEGSSEWDRKYYLFEVEVFVPATQSVELNLVTDPYSLALSPDSRRSQIVDLSDENLEPEGWGSLDKPGLNAPEDIVIYELHVRDFSIADETVPELDRGTFRAFTHADSDGMRHLRALADAGLTHVHLLPSFDFATVPERREDQLQPEGDLSSYPPDSDMQQDAIAAVKDRDGFNWGYDPWHYTVPEGAYATDPVGAARTVEFREMVMALNEAGLRVVMDVVYNHTTASGQSDKSVLDRIVPGYYHRLNETGDVERSTCCDNTASEHAMMEKLMFDSLRTWAADYKVDGFRFDLMGHHMKSNILGVRAMLDSLTEAEDGVDGAKIYVYGEGWNFGEVANNARGVNATQLNMPGTGIGTFSDRLRDAARGGNPFGGLQEQGFVNGLYTDPNGIPQGDTFARLMTFADQIRIGLAGNLAEFTIETASGELLSGSQIDYNGQPAGYTTDPQEVITYAAAHDNETLFDAIQMKAPPGADMATRVRMQNFANALVGLGQGIPFFHAGIDMLRSKSMDRDSFNSGDWFNALDFTYETNGWGRGLPTAEKNEGNWPIMQPLLANPDLRPDRGDVLAAADNFREILRIRNSTPLFRLTSGPQILESVRFHNTGPGQIPGVIVMSVDDDGGAIDRRTEAVAVVFNGSPDDVSFYDDWLAERPFELHPVQRASSDPVVREAERASASGALLVPGRTAAVFVAPRPVEERIDLLIGDVGSLVEDGYLNRGQGNALTVKLANARRQYLRGQTNAAVGMLGAFVNQVRGFTANGRIPVDRGGAIIAEAEDIIATIEGGAGGDVSASAPGELRQLDRDLEWTRERIDPGVRWKQRRR
jgi:pullulanase-type alpha-1,6-glucosidase